MADNSSVLITIRKFCIFFIRVSQSLPSIPDSVSGGGGQHSRCAALRKIGDNTGRTEFRDIFVYTGIFGCILEFGYHWSVFTPYICKRVYRFRRIQIRTDTRVVYWDTDIPFSSYTYPNRYITRIFVNGCTVFVVYKYGPIHVLYIEIRTFRSPRIPIQTGIYSVYL